MLVVVVGGIDIGFDDVDVVAVVIEGSVSMLDLVFIVVMP